VTDISAVEISMGECRRYMARAERALESLKAGQDNNSYTAAMKRSSSDLSDILVVVRGNHRETKSRHLVKRSETIARNEIVAPSGTHPDPSQFLCSECGCLVDLHKMISQELTGGEKVCEACFHSDAYQTRTTDKFIASLPLRTCFECGRGFHSESPCQWKGEIHCDDCFHMVSQEKCEPVSGAWKNTPGTSNGRYRCMGDEIVELAYGTCTPVKIPWVEIWSLVECKDKLKEEIMSLLGKEWTGNKNAAISTFVTAVRAGKIPEAPAGDE